LGGVTVQVLQAAKLHRVVVHRVVMHRVEVQPHEAVITLFMDLPAKAKMDTVYQLAP
jgi:hypothetical protein